MAKLNAIVVFGEFTRISESTFTDQRTGKPITRRSVCLKVDLSDMKRDEVFVRIPDDVPTPELLPKEHYGVPAIIETSAKSKDMYYRMRPDLAPFPAPDFS